MYEAIQTFPLDLDTLKSGWETIAFLRGLLIVSLKSPPETFVLLTTHRIDLAAKCETDLIVARLSKIWKGLM